MYCKRKNLWVSSKHNLACLDDSEVWTKSICLTDLDHDDVIGLIRGCDSWWPCRPPRCSWRSPWTRWLVAQRGSCHHCAETCVVCSWQLRWATITQTKKKSLSALLKHPTCGTTMQSVMVSLSPATTLLYLSVFTVHNTTTSSTLFFSLNSLVHRNVHEREKEGEFLSLSTWWCPWSAP